MEFLDVILISLTNYFVEKASKPDDWQKALTLFSKVAEGGGGNKAFGHLIGLIAHKPTYDKTCKFRFVCFGHI